MRHVTSLVFLSVARAARASTLEVVAVAAAVARKWDEVVPLGAPTKVAPLKSAAAPAAAGRVVFEGEDIAVKNEDLNRAKNGAFAHTARFKRA